MNLKEIADGLSAKFNIAALAVENEEVALEIDGIPIVLSEGMDSVIVMTGFIGEAPAEGGEVFANLLLEGTMGLMDTKPAALARNPETGAYALVQRVGPDGLSLDSFSEALGDFTNLLETWRGMLENFRPAADAAKASVAAQPGAHELSMGGFMQV